MQIDFDKRYPVAATPEQAWAVLADVRTVGACWPGAVISSQADARRYHGTMGLELGTDAAADARPAATAVEVARFDGAIELLAMDAATRGLRLRAEGRETRGSTATAELTARVENGDIPGSSALVGRVSIVVDGPLAQLDRRLLASVGDRLLARFAENFRIAAAAVPAPPARKGASGHAGALASAGADSTLTLMVQAGQAPGAAFADPEGAARERSPDKPGLRAWLARKLRRDAPG